MTEKLTDEQIAALRDSAWFVHNSSIRAIATEVLESRTEIARLREALRTLVECVKQAREDEDVDAMTAAGGYICGDVWSDALDDARAALGGRDDKK